MSPAACFRCDWQGATRDRDCPSCGAPLYRRPRAPAPFLADEAEPERDDRPRRSPPPGVSIGVALVVAVAVVVAIELFPGAVPSRRSSAASHDRAVSATAVGAGSLVYLTASDDLWIVDLQAGGAGPGPNVPDGTRELVDLSGAGPGWLGIERAREGRMVSAAVVRGVHEDADVVGLGHGDLVAWGPEGTSLVFARNGHADRDGCAPVRINLVTVATRQEQWALDDPGFCGPVLSLSRSTAATYFTAASGDRLSVYLTGAVGVPHLMFDGLGVLSAAPPSAFLLNAHASQETLDLRPSRGGTMLGWKGIGGPITVGDGTNALTVERILSWSGDGSHVALVGALGEREGLFVLSAAAGTGPRVPRFVMPARRTMDATFDASGGLYLSANGHVFVERGGVLTRAPLPADAPEPAGPIVWIP
jgi:hypothetical protein